MDFNSSIPLAGNETGALNRSLFLLREALYPNILYFPIGLTAVILNVLVATLIYKTKSLHTKCFVLLAVNACGDLLLGAGYTAVGIARVSRYYFGVGEVMTVRRCCAEVCDIAFAQLVSLGLATVLVIDRVLSVLYWKKYRLWEKRKWTSILVGSAVLYAMSQLCVHFGDSWLQGDRVVLTCGIEDTVTAGHSYVLLGLQMTTSLVVVVLNIVLWRGIKRQKQKIHASGPRNGNENDRVRLERDTKTFKTITIILVMHLLTHLGSRLVIFVVSALAGDSAKTTANRYGRSLVVMNAAVHFFILYTTSSKFCQAARAFFSGVSLAPSNAAMGGNTPAIVI